MLRSQYFVLLAISLALVFSGCGQKDSTKKVYKIGVIAPLSGEAAEIGSEMKKILDYHLEETEKTSQADYRLELFYEDGKCDGASAASAFQKLNEKGDLHFIIGGICSTESLAIAPLLKEKGIVAISPITSDPDLEGKSSNFFSLSYTNSLMEDIFAEELGHFKKIAIISEKNIFNQALAKVVEEKLKTQFPETQIVVHEEFENTKTDLNNTLEKIKTSQVEAIFLNTTPGVSAEMLLQGIQDYKNLKVKLISHISYNNAEMLKKFSAVTEGMTIIDVPEITTPSFLEMRNKIVTFNGSLDSLNSYYIASTLDTFDLLNKLIGEHQGDTTKVQEALSKETFTGYLGKIYFGDKAFVQEIKASKFMVKNGELIKQ